MNSNDRHVAEELKRRLSAVVPLVDFRVFGSRARGDAEEDSDLDVFIEVESLDPGTEEGIRDVVWELGMQREIYISPLIITRREVEETPLRAAPIILNIQEEGVRV